MSNTLAAINSNENSTESVYRTPSQARGVAKFEKILDAAHHLIEQRQDRDISLYDVAEQAGVATGSVYHFFPSMEAIQIALVERYDEAFGNIIRNVAPKVAPESWQELLVMHTEFAREYINAHPPALMLIIGPLRTWQSRQADTLGDTRIAQAMVENYSRFFELPISPSPSSILHYAIRILEGFWELSYQQHSHVTETISLETNRAMIAYLNLYWPKYLPRGDSEHGNNH